MKWLEGTGPKPIVYQISGLILLLLEGYYHDAPAVLVGTLFGAWGLSELARIRDEIRKFNE